MKKKIMGSLLISAILLGGAMQVLAASENVTGEDNEYSSKANVNIIASEEATEPEVPNEPNKGETGQKGPLSLDNVIHFDFGETKLTSIEDIKNLESTTPQNVQITDNRGTGAGWKLQVSQSKLIDAAQDDRELKGAAIIMGKGNVVAGTGNKTVGPTIKEVTMNETDQVLMTAAKDHGMGTWMGNFNTTEEAIRLSIPTGNYVGNYVGTVTWKLTDGPAS